jgi:hypothetical protein
VPARRPYRTGNVKIEVYSSLYQSEQYRSGSKERVQVLTAESIKMAVFLVVGSCSLVEVYRRFRAASFLHHHPADSEDIHLQEATLSCILLLLIFHQIELALNRD